MRIKSTGSLVGGSIRSLAAAAFMSRNGNLPGDHISILLEGKNFGKLVIRVAIDYSLLSRLGSPGPAPLGSSRLGDLMKRT